MASYSNVSGFEIVFAFEESVTGPYHDIGGPFEIVLAFQESVTGPYHDVGQPFEIVVTPDAVARTLRGGGQSTVEWDWVRGKSK